MRVTMTRTQQASPDGVTVQTYEAGTTYEMPARLAVLLKASGAAVDEAPTPPPTAFDTAMLEARVFATLTGMTPAPAPKLDVPPAAEPEPAPEPPAPEMVEGLGSEDSPKPAAAKAKPKTATTKKAGR
jgi:hypothetical protein